MRDKRKEILDTWKNVCSHGSYTETTGPNEYPYAYRFTLSKSFQKFHKTLISQLRPTIEHQLIFPMKGLLESFMAPYPGGVVEFRVRCQLLDFLETEFSQNERSNLGSILITVGSPEYAVAVICSVYMQRQWGIGGLATLELLSKAVEKYFGKCSIVSHSLMRRYAKDIRQGLRSSL